MFKNFFSRSAPAKKMVTPTLKNHAKFNLDYDDSSDEEETKAEQQEYSIEESWQNAQKDLNFPNNKNLANDKFLSFIAHAAGIKMLYSTPINQVYYPLKHQLLGRYQNQTAQEQLQLLINNTLENTVDEVLDNIAEFIKRCHYHSLLHNHFEEMYKSIRNEFLSEMHAHINRCFENIMKCIAENKYFTTIENMKYLDDFIKTCYELLTKKCLQKIQVGDKKTDIEHIKSAVFKLATEQLHTIFVELNIEKNKNLSGKEAVLQALSSYEGNYNNLVNYCKTILVRSSNSGYVYASLVKLLNDPSMQFNFTHAFLDDLTNKQKLTSDEENSYQNFYTFCSTNIKSEITDRAKFNLTNNFIVALKNYYRPILASQHRFSSHHPLQFYANLRLSNRSQQRTIANLQSSLFTQQEIARIWNLTEKFDASADVTEQQTILENSFGRRDMVLNVGNYKKIYDAIVKLKIYASNHLTQTISDKEVAQWLRAIFINETIPLPNATMSDLKIHQYLQTMTYLMFGCEVSRNPSMSVINQMLLDLIIANRLTFEEVLVGKKDGKELRADARMMPMAPEGAVAAARTLNEKYKDYMPHAYSYPGTEDKDGNDGKLSFDHLAAFEAKIFRAWLNEYHKESLPKNNQAAWLLNAVESQFKRWFVTESDQPSFSLNMKAI